MPSSPDRSESENCLSRALRARAYFLRPQDTMKQLREASIIFLNFIILPSLQKTSTRVIIFCQRGKKGFGIFSIDNPCCLCGPVFGQAFTTLFTRQIKQKDSSHKTVAESIVDRKRPLKVPPSFFRDGRKKSRGGTNYERQAKKTL